MKKRISKEAKDIIARFEAAIRSATIYNVNDLRAAAIHLYEDTAEDAAAAKVVVAFVELLNQRADKKEQSIREAFGQ